MELSPICKKEYPALRALYRSAFPAAERMPLSRFFALQKKGQAEILALRTGGAFAGLMIVTFAPGYALLNYFAVEPDCRSMGLGSRALPALQQRYPNRQVVLEVEHDGTLTQEDRQKIQSLLAKTSQGATAGGQVGLRNVSQRLNLIYGDEGTLTLDQTRAGTVLARVAIPAGQ